MQPWADPDGGAASSAGRVAGPRVGVLHPRRSPRRHGLRPLATFEIVDQATSFWRRRIGVVVGVTLAATLPVQLLAGLACHAEVACGGVGPTSWVATLFDGRYDPIVALALGLAAVLAAQLAAAAVVHLVTAERLGNELAGRAALALGLRRLWAIGLAWVIGHVVMGVSAVTVVGPFAVLALFLVTTPAIAVEGLGPIAGLRRAARLARRRFWPLLGVALASGLVATLLGLALAALPIILSSVGATQRWRWLLSALATELQLLVSVPLTATAATLAYLDARVRTEGLDLQIDADRAFAAPGVVDALAG